MSTWYGVWKGTGEIREVEVEKFTDKTLTINGRRQVIDTAYMVYYDNLLDAVAHSRRCIIRRYENGARLMEAAERDLKELNAKYGELGEV
jgi:hypothetical protein